ncbi:MAG: CoA-binding protein [Eudoraea sp.]|nr:CoA-binding protein [Eudoraea sp.]
MKNTLVLGASLKPSRYSHITVKRLAEAKEPTMAFGLFSGSISGVQVYTDFKKFKDVHTVTLYVNPTHQKEYYDRIINLRPHRVLFNPGTENPEFYTLLKKEGIIAEVACTLVLLATDQYKTGLS